MQNKLQKLHSNFVKKQLHFILIKLDRIIISSGDVMFKQMNEIRAARNLKLDNEIIEKPFNFFFFDSEKEESENKMKKARLKNNSIKKMLGRSKSEGINFESCEQKKKTKKNQRRECFSEKANIIKDNKKRHDLK